MKILNNFLHTLESCWLCLRFPFLYPRNRFTGKHKVNILNRLIQRLYKNSSQLISITGKQETENVEKYYPSRNSFFNYHYELKKDEKKLYIWRTGDKVKKENDLTSILWNPNKFEILGTNLVFCAYGTPVIQIMVKIKDKNDKSSYGFYTESIEFITNKLIHFLYKIVSWIDEKILDKILFIPTYTELDAMEPGWKKAFGIQMCKDLRKQLIKEHYLFKYRIIQIKEKWGYLHWYDSHHSNEIGNIITKYENLSWNTCLVCGNPSTKISSGWYSPYCDNCYPNHSIACKEKINDEWVETQEYKEFCEKLYGNRK